MDVQTYDLQLGEFIITPKELEKFFNDIETVCKKYNLSISHEDGHGSFIIEKYDKFNIEWLRVTSKAY